jgi:hypothetical protein
MTVVAPSPKQGFTLNLPARTLGQRGMTGWGQEAPTIGVGHC